MLAIHLFAGLTAKVAAFAEAEDCRLVSQVDPKPSTSIWASGGRFTPQYWAQTKGDSITWSFRLDHRIDHARLVVRYAYDANRFRPDYQPKRALDVRLGEKRLALKVPSTGAWIQYENAFVDLGSLAADDYTLTIEATDRNQNTDIDCLGILEGASDPPAPFQNTKRESKGNFVLRVTPNANLTMQPEDAFKEFERIYAYQHSYSGWKTRTPIGVNIVEDARWDANASAYSNGDGAFFRASVFERDCGNWCHEMSHILWDGRIPHWLDESLVRVMTAMVWMPRLYPGKYEQKDLWDNGQAAGKRFHESTARTDNLTDVLYGLAVKYGDRFWGDFLKAAGPDLPPDRPLTKEQVARYLNMAAGEDVEPLLKRWTGWEAAS